MNDERTHSPAFPGGRDTLMHATLQPWSAGDIFPAVITVVEFYADPEPSHRFFQPWDTGARFRARYFDLTLYGRTKRYPTYDAAAETAHAILAGRLPHDALGSRRA